MNPITPQQALEALQANLTLLDDKSTLHVTPRESNQLRANWQKVLVFLSEAAKPAPAAETAQP